MNDQPVTLVRSGISIRRVLCSLVFVIPLLAGWAVGFFLREVQATVIPYNIFLFLGSLAGQLPYTPPHRIELGSEILVVMLWVVWSWTVHIRTRAPLIESLRRDACSYPPLLVLPSIALAVDHPSWVVLKYALDPLVLLVIASVFAIKSWHWNRAPQSATSQNNEPCGHWVWLMFGAATVLFATLGVLQYRSWNVAHVDTGAFEEMLWKTLHGQFLWANVYHNTVIAYHVQLNQLLWLPIYALWPSMECLTILQAIALASGVFPVWWLARQIWGDRTALWFPILYLFQPSLHFANNELIYNTYRPEVFIVPTLLFGIYFLERERYGWAAVFGFLLLMSREEMGLVVASAGVYLACAKKYRAWGTCVAVVGILYLLLCMCVIIPHFNSASVAPRLGFQGLGTTPSEIMGTAIKQPTLLLTRMLDPNNLLYVSYLLLPLGLLSLGRPSLAVVALPIILVAMLMTGGVHNSIYFHYHYAQFALLMAATPAGAAALAAWLSKWSHSLPSRVQASVLTFALSGAFASTFLGSKTPLSLNFYYPRTSPFHYSVLYVRTPHTQALERIKALIPTDKRVSASIFVASHLVRHRDCYLLAGDYDNVDFILVDVNSRWKKGSVEEMKRWGENGPSDFVPVHIEDGIFLFQRKMKLTD